ncbi:MAG: DUF3806 domain-containing protein [Phycisphaerales bacterium]
MSDQQIQAEPLSHAERNWINEQRAACLNFVNQLLERDAEPTPSIPDLHHAFDVWLDQFVKSTAKRKLFSKKPHAIDPNAIALSFGVVFGDHLAEATSLDWMIVTDAYGTDMMLYAPGEVGKYTDVINAPMNMVAKRIESRTRDWLEPTFNAVVEELRSMAR